MKEIPALLIKVDVDDTPKFLAAIDLVLHAPWSRDKRQPHPDDPHENMVFIRGKFGEPGSLLLGLLRSDSETLEAHRVIPYDFDLTPIEHQAVLDDFRQKVLNRIADTGLITAVLPRVRQIPPERPRRGIWPPCPPWPGSQP
jgi:hypothetical protein